MDNIDWSSLCRKEDWWACWIGWLILLMAIAGWIPDTPKIKAWTSLSQGLPKNPFPCMFRLSRIAGPAFGKR